MPTGLSFKKSLSASLFYRETSIGVLSKQIKNHILIIYNCSHMQALDGIVAIVVVVVFVVFVVFVGL